MQPLSGLDASFLYLELPHVPMHVGSVLVFEGSMKFEDFRQTLVNRLHLVPRMQQRLVTVPLQLGRPSWADDPDFDLDLHLQHIALPRPGGWRQLRRLAARTFSVPLDRSRPLWEILFVEGLDTLPQVPPGSVALISKVHHAAIDGVSGADMMSILFDASATPRKIPPPPQREVSPIPNELRVLAASAAGLLRKPKKLPQLITSGLRALRAGAKTRVQGLEAPPAPFTAPPTPLNQVISPQRVWNTALLSLDRVKALKSAMKCTLNDVVLAICAGALRRYLLDKDALPSDPLVAMVPVSVRAKHQQGSMGNQVSAMLLQLATNIADPVDRLQAVHNNAQGSKAYQDAIGAQSLADFAEFIPFGLAGRASRVYSRFRISERLNPMFNVVITNVPGPQVDLYIARHRLLTTMGMAPVIDGMGLIITVLSYNGVLSISPTSASNIMPDIDVFARYLREAANELEAAVLALRPPPAAPPVDDARVAEVTTAFFERMRSHLAGLPETTEIGAGTFQLRVTGSNTNNWVVGLSNRSVNPGEVQEPDATITIGDRHLAQILAGNLDPQMAFVQGKLRVHGNIGKGLALGALMSKVATTDQPSPVA